MNAFTPLLFLVFALGDWNPDKADLVFTSNRDGDNTRVLVESGWNDYPRWSLDGK